MAITLDGTNGITTETGTGDISVGDDLIFTGTGNRITGDFSNATVASRVAFQTSTSNTGSEIGVLPNGTGNYANLNLYNSSDPANSSIGRFSMQSGELRILSANAGTGSYLPMTFYTGGSERMRVDTSGNLRIGTTSSLGKVGVEGIATNGYGYFIGTPASYTGIAYWSNSVTAAGTGWLHFYGTSSANSVINIVIYGNGNILNANNSYGGLSDVKLKENIVDATPKLEKLCQVRVVNYNLKGDYEQHKQLGVIAQEIEPIFPGLVEETADRDADNNDLGTTTKSVKYSVFVPMLIKAVQELKAINDAQASRIETLEAKVAALEANT